MKIGVTGHQRRPGIDWSWVRREIEIRINALPPPAGAYSCLASGSDQIFADIVLSKRIPLLAVIPLENYEAFFDDQTLTEYRRLLRNSIRIELNSTKQPEQAFFDAGKYIVDKTDLLFAIWDGQSAQGPGGTAEIVAYASCSNKAILHLDTSRKLATQV